MLIKITSKLLQVLSFNLTKLLVPDEHSVEIWSHRNLVTQY